MLCVLQIVATSCLRCRVVSDNLCPMAKMALGKGLSALIAAQPAPAPGIAAVDDPERIQRVSLNPIEEAQGYARLAGEFGMRQEEIAQKVGRSRTAVANAMRLLDLHEQVQTWLTQDLISVGHAKVLLALKAPEEQLAVAETVLRRSATVRATERLVARQLGQAKPRRRRPSSVSVNASAVEHLQSRLQEHLGTRVVLHHGEKQGRIEIEYYGAEDLQRIMQLIGLPPEN